MGCFNVTGFFSKLPLQAGDDMVLIFCADHTRVAHADALPIYVAEKYVPLNAPIYCKYNDYGSVFEKEIIRDANVDFFEKSIGMTCEKLCDLLHEFGSLNLEDISAIKKNKSEEEHEPHGENYDKQLDELERVLSIFLPEDFMLYQRWRDKIGLVWIMEHKDVYEKVSKIGEGSLLDDWSDDTDIVAKRCEQTFNAVKDYPQFDQYFNLLQLTGVVRRIEDTLISQMSNIAVKEESDKVYKLYVDIHKKYPSEYASFLASSCLTEGVSYAFPTYSSILGSKEWEKYKKNFIDFFRFTRVMHSIRRTFELSTYASQRVYTKPLSKVNEIINDKTKEICKEYEKAYS